MFANSLENSFVFALSCAWISRPMTTSHPSFAFEYALRHGPQVRAVDLVAVAVNLVTHMLRDLMRQCRSLGGPSHPARIQTHPKYPAMVGGRRFRDETGVERGETDHVITFMSCAGAETDRPTHRESIKPPPLADRDAS